MIKLLVIEKENGSLSDVCTDLENNGFHVETVCSDSISATQLRCISYALLLCDLTSGGKKEIKTFLQNQKSPVLWLSVQTELPLTCKSFRMGMEDYVVMPVGTVELLARIHMLMRCAGIDTGRKLTIGSLFLDADARIAVVDGREILLTMREFDIVFGLLSAPERAFSRKELMQKYWGEESRTSPRAVDVYMTKLRDKFSVCKDFQFVTVHGIGYKAVLR